ncbi:MAG: succinylglutamate desuccinylase/aspartoacylase family protein [Planctomycetes bacterium]|nr:succinylglutamate desuccinylase/aspartoacylase family protein [Planctomycetota bacterium]
MNEEAPQAPHLSGRRKKSKQVGEVDPRPLRVDEYPAGQRVDLLVPLYRTGLGQPVNVPFVVLRGKKPGPVLGVSAAVHGDELNGIRIIHNVLKTVDPELLSGTLICAPVANVPAFEAGQRRFPEDERDLNHVFPGKKEGTASEQYARAFLTTFLPPCDFLVDIHTASRGRINSLYVRADLHQPEARRMALLMHPQIVLHGRSGDGTLRNAARVREIPAITVEAGNPSTFQGHMVYEGEAGVLRIMAALGLMAGDHAPPPPDREPVICKTSRWLRTRAGGLLTTHFGLTDKIEKRDLLVDLVDPFGHAIASYRAPAAGVVIGMSRDPVAVPGTRYCHLGAIGEPPDPRERSREGPPISDER